MIGTIPLFETAQDGVNFFFSSVIFNFYSLFAVLTTLLFALELLPWIPGKKMREAIRRSREKGLLDRRGAVPMAAGELTEFKIPKNRSEERRVGKECRYAWRWNRK